MGFPRIRSTRLSATFLSAPGTYRVLVLGAQSSVIVKEASFQAYATTPGNVAFAVVGGASNTILLSADFATARWTSWQGWHVLQDADELHVTTDQGSVSLWISGTLLQGIIDSSVVPIGAGQLPAIPPAS